MRSRMMICQCDAGHTENRALVGARPIDWGRNKLKLGSRPKPTRGKEGGRGGGHVSLGHIFARGWMGKPVQQSTVKNDRSSGL